MEIEEGNFYYFIIDKIFDLAGTNYYVLNSEFDKKYLMPTKFYSEYNFKINDKIKCKIDRINCNGKVFLEPECPIYSIGDIDVFTLLETEERLTHKSKDKYLVVKTINEKTKKAIIVINQNSKDYSLGEKWSCEIIKIKKGEMYLKMISKV